MYVRQTEEDSGAPPHRGARAKGGTTDRQMAAVTFERVVRDAMDRKELTLYALAAASGVKRTQWYTYFDGSHVPRRETLAKAAGVLGVSLEDLLAPFPEQPPRRGRESVTDPGLAELTAAIVALTRVLSGDSRLVQAIREGLSQDQDQAPEDRPQPSRRRRRSSPSK